MDAPAPKSPGPAPGAPRAPGRQREDRPQPLGAARRRGRVSVPLARRRGGADRGAHGQPLAAHPGRVARARRGRGRRLPRRRAGRPRDREPQRGDGPLPLVLEPAARHRGVGRLRQDRGVRAPAGGWRPQQDLPGQGRRRLLDGRMTKTIYELSKPGRRAFTPPQTDVPETPIADLLPESAIRTTPPELPEIAEPEIVRHYTNVSRKNFHLDEDFYPLGSCTMKYNPKLNERVAALPGHSRLHPLQDDEYAQGALDLMFRLQGQLSEIAGLPHVSLQPSAGSHGELAGLLLTRAYHEDRGEKRTKVLTPDTAHGTNPATVTMAGFEVVKFETAPDGGVDLDDLRAKAEGEGACPRPTNPNTLGLFDRNIEELASIVHDAGATLYYDGANLNAVVGVSRPGDMG